MRAALTAGSVGRNDGGWGRGVLAIGVALVQIVGSAPVDLMARAASEALRAGPASGRVESSLVGSDLSGDPPSESRYAPPNRTTPRPSLILPFAGFSSAPADAEITRARVLSEPLVPIGGRTSLRENAALARALDTYQQEGAASDTRDRVLARFLEEHRDSPWRASVLFNLGLQYRTHGAVARALSAFDDAWRAASGARDAPGRAIADAAIGEWLTMTAALGRRELAESRLREIEGRPLSGMGASKIARARDQLALAARSPSLSVPSERRAFERLLSLIQPSRATGAASFAATGLRFRTGRTIGALVREAESVGVSLVPVMRAPGARFAAPALVHLTTGQVVALVKSKDDRHLTYDPALNQEVWVTEDTLAQEASGYALLPRASFGRGWIAVSAAALPLALTICPPGEPDDGDPPPAQCCVNGACPSGLATYRFHPSTAGLLLHDDPIGYHPSRGPAMAFGVSYHSREIDQPVTFSFANLGPKWRFDWLGYIEDYPRVCPPNGADCFEPSIQVMLRGGGKEAFTAPSPSGVYDRHWRSRSVVVRTATSPLQFERRLPDGTIEYYGLPDGAASGTLRRVFLTAITDPRGQSVHLTYDGQFRLVAITDAVGQVSTVAYELGSDPLKITKVTDPFGRVATFSYTADGQLASITDIIGLTSSFLYGEQNVVTSMTTPYGTTTFRTQDVRGASLRFIEATDPLGGTERLEYWVQHDGLPTSVPSMRVPTGFAAANRDLNNYVTLYWDKRAMTIQPRDVSQAIVTRWLLRAGPDFGGAVVTSVPRAVKRPLEEWRWYHYDQALLTHDSVGRLDRPIVEARVLDDGTSRISQSSFNTQGSLTSRIDPFGRRTSYVYATNGEDLQEVRQTTGGANDLLAQYSGYNAQHLPTTIVDAAGQSTTLTYNAAGQVLTVTNAKSETTTNVYDADGHLQSVTGPVSGATTSYTYDSYGRVRTTTDADGYVVTTDYDLFDRPVKTTYPDATFEQTVYDKLDPVRRRDRLGRWSYTFYDALRRVVATRDPLGRTIQQQWCSCGSLDALIDGKGQKTRWERDLQGRVTREVRADNVTATAYTYEASSGRLKTVTDPKLQVTTYTYNLDDSLQQVAYTNAQIATPSVSYTYETAYSRLATMVDGIGTTTYGYKAAGTLGAGQVASVDGPLTDDTITYTYDQLGRVTVRAINGVANQTTQTYDALGRVTTEVNPLGSFTYGYDGVTPRLASVAYPNGQTSAYAYYNNAGDHRLQTIHHKRPGGATLSKFDYTYDAVGNIATWQQQADSNPPVEWRYTYDGADQLLTAYQWSTGTPSTVLKRYAYTYDLAANRTTEQIDDGVTLSTYDVLNRLVNQQAGGGLRVAGTVSEPADVRIQGRRATVTADGRFTGATIAVSGVTTFAIEATDSSGNSRLQLYEVDALGLSRLYSYDANGNMTSDGSATMKWNAVDRLVSYETGTRLIEYAHDGLWRTTRISEVSGGVPQAAERIVWCGRTLCQARDEYTGVVRRDYWHHAARVGAESRYVATDHLGSVREVLDGAALDIVRLAYEPYGLVSVVSGADDVGVAYTGHRRDRLDTQVTSLYRVYDPSTGRWLSEDPIGREGGINLFSYVGNDPISTFDPLGLRCYDKVLLVTAYCDRGPGSDWSYYKPTKGKGVGSVGPGTVAVANSRTQPYCYGSTFTVKGETAPDYRGEAHDTGAGWDADHHNVKPEDWIDIWLPCKQARQWGKQWRTVTVCDCQPSCYM